MKPNLPLHLAKARTVVLKIGSALLVDPSRHHLRESWLAGLAQDIAMLHRRGQQVLMVSSGAIALGRRMLGYEDNPLPLERSQAAAAVGQIRLAEAYATSLAPFGITTAQVLLTLGDTQDRRRYLNARATLATLLDARAVPVINENDTVATRRNPIWRQRSPRCACGADGGRRSSRNAFGYRRPVHRGSQIGPERIADRFRE